MWPYPWTHVGTPSHLGHMDRVAATMPSQAHAGAAQEAPDIGQWEGQDVPLVRPSSCNVKGGIPSSRRYLPTYLWFVCAASWATWLLFTRVPAWWVVLRLLCPATLGSCSPVCPLCVLCCVCAVLGHLAPVHRCACSVLCFACAVSWATWLLFTGAPAPCVALRVRCRVPRGSFSPVRPLSGLCCACGVLGHLAPVHRCEGSVGCVACTVSWAAWLLYTRVLARCAVLWAACAVWGEASQLFVHMTFGATYEVLIGILPTITPGAPKSKDN